MDQKKIIIIGGGITGLTAAYYLQKKAREEELPIEVKLIEASGRLGGVIRTETRDGFVIERGPDSIIARKKSALRLIEEVGLQDKIISNTAGRSYIYARGRLHTMPEGSFMGIPTKVTPFALSGLFSPLGKLRAAGDFILPKGEPKSDQSLGVFFRRRLGNEVVENLIDPLLSGIYAGDIDELSLMALFPNFYEIEQKYRSLVIGLNKSMPKPPKTAKKPGSKKGMFISLSTGLEELVRQVERRLEKGSVLKGKAVNKVERTGSTYQVYLETGEVETADSVVIATDHFHAQRMLSAYPFMEPFKHMPANSVANVAMAFPKSAIEKDIDGTGFLVSRNSDFRITACTWTHKKWPGTSPDNMALLRCYVGKPDDQEAVNLTDDQITELVLRDLNKTMNIKAKPEFTIVTRWRKAMPQYTVGHLERIAKVKAELKQELPGIFLAGGSYEGVGIPGCIDQAEAAVGNVMEYFKECF